MKNFNKKILSCLLPLIAIFIILTACAQDGNENRPATDISNDTASSSISGEAAINPLTGLEINEDKVNSRPVAVMINNIHMAQPLLGVSKADILYECLVEGGITRIEAIYKDISSVGSIGSIRSARPPFITLAQGLDAIYVCCGTSTQAEDLLSQNVVDYFNLQYFTDMSFRDESRLESLGFEHSLLSSGKLITEGIQNEGLRTETKLLYNQKFSTDSQVALGESAQNISVNFSGYKSTEFLYDPDNNTYLVYQYNEPMLDSTYNVQNTADNVIILHIEATEIDDEGHIMLGLVGSGEGYYANGGKYIPITWLKESDDSPIKYYTEDGSELVMAIGRQYICCIPLSQSVTFK